MIPVIRRRQIDETPGAGRLGRHVEHDERSRSFGFVAATDTAAHRVVHHRHYGPVLDQGDLGSCTGNAVSQAINSAPLHHRQGSLLKEHDAIDLYSIATTVDDFPGAYPPEDTGSSGLSVAKAATQKGLISSYQWAFSVDDAIAALMIAPVITGVNWYEGFDHPADNGLVKIEGQVRGGHEFVIVGYEPGTKKLPGVVYAINSWGSGWGKAGRFAFSVDTWRQLLSEEGDVTILVP